MKIFCVISTCNHEPFSSILNEGTIPAWAGQLREIEVCTLECRFNSKFVRRIDSLRERNRYRSKRIARTGQLFDLFLAPFLDFVPRVKLISSNQGIKRLAIAMPEILTLYRWKYLAAFKYFLDETDCDFIYTVNASCFVNEDKLLEFLGANPELQYAGSLAIDPKSNLPFISGANRLISRSVARQIIDNRKRWPSYVLEDMGLGRLTRKLGIEIDTMPTLNIASQAELAELSSEVIDQNFHFRLKSFKNVSKDKKIREDVLLFKALSRRLEKKLEG